MGKCFGFLFNKRIIKLVACVILIISLAFVIDETGIVSEAREKDYVKIVSITPNYYRSYTVETTFVITVEYNLKSADEASLFVGYNTESPHEYNFKYACEKVTKGKGTVTLQTTVTPVDWGSIWKVKDQIVDFFKGYKSMESDFKACICLTNASMGDIKGAYASYEFPIEYLKVETEEDICPNIYWYKEVSRQNEPKDIDVDNADYFYKEEFDMSLEEIASQTLSTEFNPKLAYLLCSLSAGAYSEKCTRENYRQLGFSYENIDFFEMYNYYDKPDDENYREGSVAYTIGDKDTWDGRRVVLIVIRGSDGDCPFSKDWRSNFNFGTTVANKGWHAGFDMAADEVFNSLKEHYGEKLPSNNTFYVITGHSRGAAVGNLLSMKMYQNGVPNQNVYDYNFACPDVARDFGLGWAWNTFGNHDNMFNIGNTADVVPLIPGVFGNILSGVVDSWRDRNISSGVLEGFVLSNWGKYGNSMWFEYGDCGFGIKAHIPLDYYVNFYREQFGYASHRDNLGNSREFKTPLQKNDYLSWEKAWAKGIALSVEKGLELSVCCPVDVELLNQNGEIIGSVTDGVVDYHESSLGDLIIFVEGDCKHFLVLNDEPVTLNLVGSDQGTMTYLATSYNLASNQVEDYRLYQNIELKKNKHFSDTVSISNEDGKDINSNLEVVNRRGKAIAEVGDDGQETMVKGGFVAKITDNIWVLPAIILGLLFLIAALVTFILKAKQRSGKRKGTFSDLTDSLSGQSEGEMDFGDVMCPACGYINPAGIKTCMGCGKKIKKRKR